MNETVDHRGRPIVAVTGMDVVTCLGSGSEDNWKKLVAGESGIKSVRRFPTEGLRTRFAGTVDFVDVDPFSSTELAERLAMIVTEGAVAQSAIGDRSTFPGPLFLGAAPVEIEWPQRLRVARATLRQQDQGSLDYEALLHASADPQFLDIHKRYLFGSIADRLHTQFGTRGIPVTLSTACASGATAIQLGVEAIRRGEADASLCVATDASVNPEAMIRFSLLSALSTRNDAPSAASRPFSRDRDGFVMAEGAAALVLERAETARARGARILGYVVGCGERADTFHRTRPSPDGKPVEDCIRNALADAGLSARDIDYVNAHGTSTPENDRMEYLSMLAVFGERISRLPLSSNKSIIGHTLSAAGAIEAVFALLTLQKQRLPPTINYEIADPAIPLDVVPNSARDASVRRVMSNSFGFGGQNVSLIFSAAD
jgi:3-oxoacyl-[acyl-carrier-protein] synthase II